VTEKVEPATDRNELHDLFEPLSGNAKNIPPTDPRRRVNRLEKCKPTSPSDRDTLE
jgi:hypothetical protein